MSMEVIFSNAMQKVLKTIGITFLISLFFVAPIVNVIVSYSDVLSEDALELILSSTSQEEEEDKDLQLDDLEEYEFVFSQALFIPILQEKSFLKELKGLKISFFDPELFIPPPKNTI